MNEYYYTYTTTNSNDYLKRLLLKSISINIVSSGTSGSNNVDDGGVISGSVIDCIYQ